MNEGPRRCRRAGKIKSCQRAFRDKVDCVTGSELPPGPAPAAGGRSRGRVPGMNPFWIVRTGRLVMRPVSGADLPALQALKADPRVFAVMLGGVRSRCRTVEELAEEIVFWGRCGVGIWAVRHRVSGVFLGITGFMDRPDGLGIGLRFAFVAGAHGQGYASEAAGAALRFAHERAGIARVAPGVATLRRCRKKSRTALWWSAALTAPQGGCAGVVDSGFVVAWMARSEAGAPGSRS